MPDQSKEGERRGWHSRGYLPHFDGGELFQTITFRLHDSMPQDLLDRWKVELTRESEQIEDKLRWRIEAFLDSGYGGFLRDNRVATMVQSALLHFDGARYRLSAWIVNHVHVHLAPNLADSLSSIVHSIKSFTAQEANKILRRKGKFWFEDYFDRRIRNSKHYENAVRYIEENPVKAGLCRRSDDWAFSRASHRALAALRIG